MIVARRLVIPFLGFVVSLASGGAVFAAEASGVAIPAAEPSAPAQPPTPQQVVERCVAMIANTAHMGVRFVSAFGDGSVRVIHRLDEQGAPDAALQRAAHKGHELVNTAGRTAAERINRLADRCLALLMAIHAPEEAGRAVNEARHRALGVLLPAVQRANEAIANALEMALGNSPAA